VDLRARAKLVSRGWNSVLSEVSLWTRLDLSRCSGVRVRVTDAVLRGAAGLARGGLTALDVSGCWHVTHEALLAVVAVNGGALTELRVCHGAGRELPHNVEALSRAAPLLRVLDVNVAEFAGEQLLSLLRKDAPFGPLRMHRLHALCHQLAAAEHEAAVTALAAGVGAHDSLSSLTLQYAALDAPAVLDAVVDAVLLRRMHSLELSSCRLTPASALALARLLGGGALAELRIWNSQLPVLDAPAAALLANALRDNSTLATLMLGAVSLWWHDTAAAVAFLTGGALTGHASLHTLRVYYNTAGADNAVAAGAALRALVAANAPTLRELDMFDCRLGAVCSAL
jgi:hypothetical protein